jgi:hypothetical protein
MRYLNQRGLHDPALIQELQIGYAPGRSLRRHLTTRGYSFDLLRQFSLLNSQGPDAFYPRIVFPLRQDEPIVNLYGRSLGTAFAHRFLPGSKGGLYGLGGRYSNAPRGFWSRSRGGSIMPCCGRQGRW